MKKTFITILKVVVLVVIFIWIVMVFTDYFRVRQHKSPMFCLSEVINDYEDGSTSICNGFLYKAIRYERNCLTATEFGPFLIKERTCESNN